MLLSFSIENIFNILSKKLSKSEVCQVGYCLIDKVVYTLIYLGFECNLSIVTNKKIIELVTRKEAKMKNLDEEYREFKKYLNTLDLSEMEYERRIKEWCDKNNY